MAETKRDNGDTTTTRPQQRASLRICITHLLTYMHLICILMHMRTTLNIDDEILRRASDLTGIREKTSLVRLGLEALIAR